MILDYPITYDSPQAIAILAATSRKNEDIGLNGFERCKLRHDIQVTAGRRREDG